MRLNWFNYNFAPADGYGRFGMYFVRALARADVDVRPYPAEVARMSPELQALALDYSHLTISCIPPFGLRNIPGRHWNFTMYEGTGLPGDWAAKINNRVERLLVPVAGLVDIFAAHEVKQKYIHVVPGGVEPNDFPILPSRLGMRPYTFMCLGDRLWRKGWDLAGKALWAAFEGNPDVRLIIKTRGNGLAGVDFCTARSDSNISVWAEDVRDISLKASPGTEGTVVDVKVFARKIRSTKSRGEDERQIKKLSAEKDSALGELVSALETAAHEMAVGKVLKQDLIVLHVMPPQGDRLVITARIREILWQGIIR